MKIYLTSPTLSAEDVVAIEWSEDLEVMLEPSEDLWILDPSDAKGRRFNLCLTRLPGDGGFQLYVEGYNLELNTGNRYFFKLSKSFPQIQTEE
jgi:hypothetical protein